MERLIIIIAVVGMFLAAGADVEAVLVDTKLLLHLDGDDGATTTIDSSPGGHTINFNPTAQLDTAEKIWGPSSLILDGNSDYLSVADSPDWDIGGSSADDWTIDLWVKHTDHADREVYLAQYEDGFNQWFFYHQDGIGLKFRLWNAMDLVIELTGDEITDSEWHHVAWVKVADEHGVYLDGQQVAYVQDSDTHLLSGPLHIGQLANGFYSFDGWMDEIRLHHSNVLDADPSAGLTDSFTPPIPEPATIALLGLGALSLLRRRKKQLRLE